MDGLRDRLEWEARDAAMSDDTRADDTRADIDPRFDPAFQRGFDSATPIRDRAPSVSRPSTPVSAPVAQPLTAPPPVPQASVEPPVATLDADETPIATPVDSATTRNPYLLLLAIVAVILVAVGVWLFVQSGAGFNTRAILAQGDYMSLDATIHAAPFVSLLGAATAIGVVFVFAAQWRKRG
jgi:hypothetical protein